MLAGSTIAAATFYLTGSNYELTFAVAIVPPALALAWMVHNFRDEVFGPVHGESECGLQGGGAPTRCSGPFMGRVSVPNENGECGNTAGIVGAC